MHMYVQEQCNNIPSVTYTAAQKHKCDLSLWVFPLIVGVYENRFSLNNTGSEVGKKEKNIYI